MTPANPSNLPQVRLFDLAWLDPEVGEGLPLAGVIEHLHQGGDVRVEHGPVDVAEGLPQAVAPKIPLQG